MLEKKYEDFQDAYEHETIKELKKRQELEESMKVFFNVATFIMILGLVISCIVAYQIIRVASFLI